MSVEIVFQRRGKVFGGEVFSAERLIFREEVLFSGEGIYILGEVVFIGANISNLGEGFFSAAR